MRNVHGESWTTSPWSFKDVLAFVKRNLAILYQTSFQKTLFPSQILTKMNQYDIKGNINGAFAVNMVLSFVGSIQIKTTAKLDLTFRNCNQRVYIFLLGFKFDSSIVTNVLCFSY